MMTPGPCRCRAYSRFCVSFPLQQCTWSPDESLGGPHDRNPLGERPVGHGALTWREAPGIIQQAVG
eukprot:2868787-Pyramimonas_sp.AAC.1